MVNILDIKTGNVFIYKDKLYLLISSQHNKTGRARAFVKAKIKDIQNNSTQVVNFSSKQKFELAYMEKTKIQYLYSDNTNLFFMLVEDYDEIVVNSDRFKWEKNFLTNGCEYEGVFYKKELISLNLPVKAKLMVKSTKDAVRGNTVSSGRVTKKATLETGMIISTPIFIKNNEYIYVSTKDGKYISRAK